MQNEVCHKIGKLYAKAAHLDMQHFRVLQRMVQVSRVLSALVLTLPIGMMVTPTLWKLLNDE